MTWGQISTLAPGQKWGPIVGSLVTPSHRLQYLVGIVEGVLARDPYLIDHLLRCVVVLDLRYDPIPAGRRVQVRQVLLQLPQIEVEQIAQVAKAHVLIPPRAL